jgi:hypothetical protein
VRLKAAPFTITCTIVIALGFTACRSGSECTDREVLKTVKMLFDRQQFGQIAETPANIFAVQNRSATFVKKDEQTGTLRCSVIVVADLLEIMKLSMSEADIAKVKEEAPKKGMPLTKDYLVNYTVQPMASGQNYVTVLP